MLQPRRIRVNGQLTQSQQRADHRQIHRRARCATARPDHEILPTAFEGKEPVRAPRRWQRAHRGISRLRQPVTRGRSQTALRTGHFRCPRRITPGDERADLRQR
jgi:hypothetical protein